MYYNVVTKERMGDILRLNNKIDIKIFILYLMKNVGEPLEYTTVNDMVLQDEFVGYFDFAFCFSELLEAGQIIEANNEEPRLYCVSKSGKETLESYESSLLPIIRERALRSALRLIAYNRTGHRIKSAITESGEGYNLNCTIADNSKTLLSIDIHIAEKEYAERLKTNFNERAEVIFRGTLALLSGDVNFIFD